MPENELTSEAQNTSFLEQEAPDSDDADGFGLSLKTLWLALFCVAMLSLLALLAYGLVNKTSVTSLSGLTRLGKPAPPLAGQLYDGDELDISQHIGKPIVINFWASWCAPCQDEQPGLESIWREYRDSEVLFVGVNIQDDESIGREYIEQFDVTYPNVMDMDGRITVDYGVIGIPVTFFVNKQGIVERRFVGAIGEDRLTRWVEDMIAGESPAGEVDAQNVEGYRELN